MSSPRLEWKVGVFVVVCLVLLGGLMVSFSRGFSVFRKTYEIRMRTSNVAGIKKDAAVLMAGVGVGTVSSAELSEDGRSVVVSLKISGRYKIYGDATFVIEQAGFLGDQYVSIIPRENKAPFLKNGDEVKCQEPFNLQEAARSAMGLLARVNAVVDQLHTAIDRVDHTLLAENTLTNLTAAVANFRTVSERTLSVVDGVNTVVQTNAPAIQSTVQNMEMFSERLQAITNLVKFSEQLNKVGAELEAAVKENRTDLNQAVKNVDKASALAAGLLDDLQAGKGMAGAILKDEKLQFQLKEMVGNLNVVSSNLSHYGLLYKPKPVKTNAIPSRDIQFHGRGPQP